MTVTPAIGANRTCGLVGGWSISVFVAKFLHRGLGNGNDLAVTNFCLIEAFHNRIRPAALFLYDAACLTG